MKRILASAAAAAMLVAGTGSGAQAQAGPSLFDLSIFGGAGYHYNWLDNLDGLGLDDDRLSPGWAPMLGAAATFWATPTVGLRTNVVYSDIDLGDEANPAVVNGWFYDLDLMLRPWVRSEDAPALLSSMYMFIGGGGFTANPPGDELGCVEPYRTTAGACLALDYKKSTVGQGTFGIGWDLVRFTDQVGFFTELAGYVYDSPFHTGSGWAPAVAGAEDRDTYGFTGRLTAGLKFMFGEFAPAFVPPPVVTPPPPPPPPAPPADRDIRVCVVQDGMLMEVDAVFRPATGDTVVMVTGEQRSFGEVHPTVAPNYGAGETWYINQDPITIDGREYVRFGVPRVIGVTQLTRVGEFGGVPVFGETGATTPQQVLYVPLRPGCEFQPYQLREEIRVRG